ncbi:ESX secretion-associated protein EspG [Nocardia higoensis]|uniref:ESX secretion-associated protein EspG n=1 Tax=Nocardia higoensis TaxID=228599 RepID=A0ABS0DAF5_9NOCA|nr:ESX secretion-associated protein EspG [Nocardia higoensis]MBF6355467.1 ESX secretion-associated protein EspG [Nocardia higoensis]
MSEWTWEPDDFAALWLRDGMDRFPRPLRYLSRFKTRTPFESHAAQVRARYDRDEHETIRLALHTLTAAQLRIEVLGGSTATRRGRVREYRIVGGRTAHHAVVLAQSAVDGVDGSVHVRLLPAESLATRLATLLPPCDPGREPATTVHSAELSAGAGHASARRSPRENYERIAGRPADGGGNAGLLVGSVLSRPAPWFQAQWYDIAGDGRYLETRTREHVAVRPATARDIAGCYAGWIERALDRIGDDARRSR